LSREAAAGSLKVSKTVAETDAPGEFVVLKCAKALVLFTLIFLLSGSFVRAEMQGAQPAAMQTENAAQGTLVLPPLVGPELPPAPPVIRLPQLPSSFLGCWEGDPGRFDVVQTDAGLVDIGAPGKIIFCYDEHTLRIPEAQVRIHLAARAVDWLMHLGLGYSTFAAHGISTDIYGITPTAIHGRTTLALTQTEHWLYFIPSRTEQPSQVDWVATLTGPDTAVMQADQVIINNGFKMWGTWHGTFRRMVGDHIP
jgi:hypothetical protein